MRHIMNFHPEWGCLAPAPSFTRTMRTVLVATAVGAVAGGGVVLSLDAHSAGGQTSVAERTLVGFSPAGSTSISASQRSPEKMSHRESEEVWLPEIQVNDPPTIAGRAGELAFNSFAYLGSERPRKRSFSSGATGTHADLRGSCDAYKTWRPNGTT
jgi:hypothetical protein